MSRGPIFRNPLYTNPARSSAYFPPSPPTATAKPKVISIPVHFVGSEPSPATKSAAGIKIQKAFRGFLVRKNVGIVRGIETEVDEMEMKFRREEEMERIVKEEKERIRMNEMLMRLLFRLDSVRGVRDYRKKVIRRVIALQEMLDSISTANQTLESKPDAVIEEVETLESGSRSDHQTFESGVQSDYQILESAVEESMEISREELKPDAVIEEDETQETGARSADQTLESAAEELKPDAAIEDAENLETDQINPMEIPQEDKPDVAIDESKIVETADELNPMEMSLENQPDEAETLETAYVMSPMDISIDNKPDSVIEKSKTLENTDQSSPNAENPEERNQNAYGWEILDTKEDEEESVEIPKAQEPKKGDGVKDVMERMAGENKKLKGLVAELCERNAQQCKLMVRLAERVESLEKTVEKMERRKKKKKKDCSILPLTK